MGGNKNNTSEKVLQEMINWSDKERWNFDTQNGTMDSNQFRISGHKIIEEIYKQQ